MYFRRPINAIVMVLNLSRKLAQQSIRNFTHTTWVSGKSQDFIVILNANQILLRSSSYPHLFP